MFSGCDFSVSGRTANLIAFLLFCFVFNTRQIRQNDDWQSGTNFDGEMVTNDFQHFKIQSGIKQ